MATGNTTKISLRYIGTAAATAFTLMGVFSVITPDQAATLKADLETLKSSIVTGYGALMDMWVILGPLAVGWLAKMGISSGTVQALIANLLKTAQSPASPDAAEAQKAIVQATGTIALDKSLPSSKEATNTLVAATIALPEVQTIVTDHATAAASPSPSVVASPDAQVRAVS